MNILFVYAEYFSYKVEEKSKFSVSEELEKKEDSIEEALVCFVCVEREDIIRKENILEVAIEEIEKVYNKLSKNKRIKSVVLYPYAHLSVDLAEPLLAKDTIDELYRRIKTKYNTIKLPFGWYKSYNITHFGEPFTELFRRISVEVKRKSHPLQELITKFRDILLNLDFEEIINPIIVDEKEIYLQYGKEAPLILDRVFYLAGLDRADIGLDKRRIQQIKIIAPQFNDFDKLREVLREYKESKCDAEELIDNLISIGFSKQETDRLLDEVFSEFKELIPIPKKLTLRSHMTSAWFSTLATLNKYPAKLFSIGPRFRREQREDKSHLMESTSVSLVVVDDSFSFEDGKRLTKYILNNLGINSCYFELKPTSSNYYQENTDTEVFIEDKGKRIEVANLGFYNKEALNNYGIKHKVFNVGFGVERIGAFLSGEEDIRRYVYTHLFRDKFLDSDIISDLASKFTKMSHEITRLKDLLTNEIRKKRDILGPQNILIYEGKFLDKNIKIWVYNWDKGKKLLSFAADNRIYVYKGEIFGLPNIKNPKDIPEEYREVYIKGEVLDIPFLELVIIKFLENIQERMKEGKQEYDMKLRIVDDLSELGLSLKEEILRFIQANNKKIRIFGPLFFGLRATWAA